MVITLRVLKDAIHKEETESKNRKLQELNQTPLFEGLVGNSYNSGVEMRRKFPFLFVCLFVLFLYVGVIVIVCEFSIGQGQGKDEGDQIIDYKPNRHYS